MSFDELEIPDKKHFKIGEVAGLLDLEPYVLRYWETEFDVLSPDKTDSGQRVYKVDDIELVHTIRHLLYDEMFTIAGARRQLERQREGKPSLLGEGAADEAEESELQLEIEELAERNAQLEEYADEQNEKLERVRGERDEFVARSEELEVQIAQLSQESAGDEELAAENAALREEVDHLENELHKARAAVSDLEEQAAELRSRLNGGASMSPELLNALKREVSQLRGAVQPS
ncbi:MAG: MerR family transcriptional regulator [Myxococcota bacterium]